MGGAESLWRIVNEDRRMVLVIIMAALIAALFDERICDTRRNSYFYTLYTSKWMFHGSWFCLSQLSAGGVLSLSDMYMYWCRSLLVRVRETRGEVVKMHTKYMAKISLPHEPNFIKNRLFLYCAFAIVIIEDGVLTCPDEADGIK